MLNLGEGYIEVYYTICSAFVFTWNFKEFFVLKKRQRKHSKMHPQPNGQFSFLLLIFLCSPISYNECVSIKMGKSVLLKGSYKGLRGSGERSWWITSPDFSQEPYHGNMWGTGPKHGFPVGRVIHIRRGFTKTASWRPGKSSVPFGSHHKLS